MKDNWDDLVFLEVMDCSATWDGLEIFMNGSFFVSVVNLLSFPVSCKQLNKLKDGLVCKVKLAGKLSVFVFFKNNWESKD